jgi:hypothetical protein
MDEKGMIVCSTDIDEGLALQIWTRGAVPRLGFVNRTRNTRKLMPFKWLEGEERTISMKGTGGETFTYPVETLEEPVRRMLYQFAQDPVFKGLLWHTVIFMSDLLHTPRAVFDRAEFSLLPEEKRCRLWLLDLTGGEENGYFRPFFPKTPPEDVFGGLPGVLANDGKTVVELKKSGVTRKLASACPQRWYDTPRIAAAAALLGFTLFHEDGADISSFLWKTVENGIPSKGALANKPDNPVCARFTRKMAGYVRHWHLLDRIVYETDLDSVETLKKRGFVRKQRLRLNAGDIGTVEYSVTLCFEEEGRMGIGCRPLQMTNRHKGEMIFTLPKEVYENALENDSFGGARDDYYSLSSLLSAKLFGMWKDRISRFSSVFLTSGG